MKDQRTQDLGDDTEPDLEALIRKAGARMEPPAAMADEVRAAVAAEWRSVVASRQQRQRRLGWTPWLAAASVAALALGTWLVSPRLLQSDLPVATVARVTGTVEYRPATSGRWQALPAAAMLESGDTIRTSGSGRVALRRVDGLEVRLDATSTLAFETDASARLDAGRIYVDAGRVGARSFEVDTTFGRVRHVGTQYSVSLANDGLEVAVREGSVAVSREREPMVAVAGETLVIASDGRTTRGTVAPYGDAWLWAQAVAPPFAIENRSLDEFLTWAARETGRQLVYGSAEVAREAESTVLKGSVAELAPEQAMGAVMATTPLLQHRIAGSQLRVDRAQR